MRVIFNGVGLFSGESCTISVDDPVPNDHGGIEAGTVIAGKNACEVLEMILFPYQYPQFTSFYIYNQPTVLEVGDKVIGGDREFRWTTINDQNIQENTITIKDITENVTLGSNLANDGSEILNIGADKVYTTPSSHTWQISALNTKGQTFYRNFTVYWRYRVYWGQNPNSNLTEDEIKNLENSALKTGYAGTYNFVNPGYLTYYYVVYPAFWGEISTWIDTDTGFGVDYVYLDDIDITNDFGVTTTYKVLRTTYQQNADLNSQIS